MKKSRIICVLMGCTALVSGATAAMAQDADSDSAAESARIADIVVTAQKREQNLQDVPISITALAADTIATNRITNLSDLGAVSPGLTVRNTYGGSSQPQITIRGALAQSGSAGQDRAVSLNLDGVYIGSPQGMSFDIPDLERIEVLRGPQGTLFGRNSTGGAINLITRDPTGEFGLRQQVTVGNYNQLRSHTRVELPQVGPLSAYVSYMHDERDGDIRNLGAGAVWNHAGQRYVSPKTLGARNSETVRVAVKFEPSDAFKTVYKYDYSSNHFTPEGLGLVVYDPFVANLLASFGLFSPAALAAINAHGNAGDGDLKRPKTLNNDWTIPSFMRNFGHTLTSTLEVSDNVTLKNISAYRKTYMRSAASGTGPGGEIFGSDGTGPYFFNGIANESATKQWSSELQLNYSSDLLDLTVGGLYYKADTTVGAPMGLRDSSGYPFTALPGRVLLLGKDRSIANSKSIGGFGQAEIHVTPELTIVGGLRLTKDKKTVTTFINSLGATPLVFPYSKSKLTYEAGANYRFSDNFMVYGKYATGYISGGAVGGYAFEPEQARSWEVGMKSDLIDRRVRFNLALFTVKYTAIQTLIPNPGTGPGGRAPSYIVGSLGDGRAKGFESELTVVPVDGLTLTGGLSYSTLRYIGFAQPVWLRPKWTANVAASYETQPLFDEATLFLRMDANYRSKVKTPGLGYPDPVISPLYKDIITTGNTWLVNGRAALQHVPLGDFKGEVAVWARNLLDSKKAMFAAYTGYGASTNYEPARTYGIDLSVEF